MNSETTASTYPLTGRRLTAHSNPWSGPVEIGRVVFIIQRWPQGAEPYLVISNQPGRHNSSREVAARGVWMGTTNNVSESAVGRAVVLRPLADFQRWQVRLIDEDDDAYAYAAEQASS